MQIASFFSGLVRGVLDGTAWSRTLPGSDSSSHCVRVFVGTACCHSLATRVISSNVLSWCLWLMSDRRFAKQQNIGMALRQYREPGRNAERFALWRKPVYVLEFLILHSFLGVIST